MIPLVAGLLTELASRGLGLIAGAIEAKGKEVVEEKLGVKIPDDPKELTPELSTKLMELQMQHEEFLTTAELEEKRLDNDNTKSARAMQAAALEQSDLFSKRFVYYFISFWSVFAALYILFITFLEIPARNLRFVDTVLGFLLGTIVACMFNFLLGSSTGSVRAQQMMRDLVEKGRGLLK